MKLQAPNTLCTVFLIVLISFSTPVVNAARYNFSLSGLSGSILSSNGDILDTYSNGRIFGFFEGEDKYSDDFGNTGSDGLITGVRANGNEVTHFSLTFTGIPNIYGVNTDTPGGMAGDEGSYLQYDIKNNSLELVRYIDVSLDGRYLGALDGNTYFFNSARSVTYLGRHGGGISASAFYVEGRDKDGNPISSAPGISWGSTEPVFVSQEVPLPGALVFFTSGLVWLGIIKRKKIA
ncbi:hypothetical protein [Methyloglobulus sp.]|uniref:hypothetical protein n=1 Tax=Methyloglobulus sp. TaxID=2518622 RepID=UPI0032B84C93